MVTAVDTWQAGCGNRSENVIWLASSVVVSTVHAGILSPKLLTTGSTCTSSCDRRQQQSRGDDDAEANDTVLVLQERKQKSCRENDSLEGDITIGSILRGPTHDDRVSRTR